MKKTDLHADCIYIATFKNTGAKYFVTGGLVSYCQFDNPKTINSNFTDNYGNYSYELASVSDAKWFKACIKEGKILPKVLTRKDLNPDLIYVAASNASNTYFVKGDLSYYTANKNLGLTKNFLDSGIYTYELASSTDTLWFNETLYGVNQPKDNKVTVTANSYIVVLKLNSISTKCAKEDYIFKQRKTLDYIAPCVDLTGNTTNDNNYLLFNKSKMLADWRYAKDKEIELYESVGKPCSIHDVKPSTSIKFEVGKWYKTRAGSFVKYKETSSDSYWKSSENISYLNKEYCYYESSYGLASDLSNFTLLTDLSEIQQYLPEGHPDKINKEWSIGTYVVFINLFCGSKKGDIDKITGTSGTNGLLCEKEEVTTKDPDYVKWFATYKEAEAFSKTLIEPTVPKYVECTFAAYSSFTVGRVYKVGSDGYVIDNSDNYGFAHWNNTNNSQFKPSTKEAFYTQLYEADSPLDIITGLTPLKEWFKSNDLEYQTPVILKTKKNKNKLTIINQ